MQIYQILDKVDSGDIALPEFQRGYVWTRDQVRAFFHSMYRAYPVGSFLTWSTKAETADTRGGPSGKDGTIQLLLDGQQRVTTLYGVTRGEAPKFFEGKAAAFTGLHFNVRTEVFEFYAPAKMKNDPTWIDVTGLFQAGIDGLFGIVQQTGAGPESLGLYHGRLVRILQIKERQVHIEEVTGPDKTVDVVVEIFNEVNSGGTKLSKGDLALAALCAVWPDARPSMNGALAQWAAAGYDFKLDWLLRNVNAVLKGEAQFEKLADVGVAEFKTGLKASTEAVSHLLDALGGRLGLDHDRVLSGRAAFPVMSRLLHQNGGWFPDAMTRDRLFYWYIHSFLWGRYAASVETTLNRDLDALDSGGVDQLIAVLRRSRGHLEITADDFDGYSIGARFYPLLYMLSRVYGAQDLISAVPLKHNMLGKMASLQVHHIFPKARLRDHGYGRGQINAVANFCFLTQDSNLKISAKDPVEYLEEVEARNPGVLASQWIPLDRDLWKVENYPDFLKARRELLADAANGFLGALRDGPSPVALTGPTTQPQGVQVARAVETAPVTGGDDEVPGMDELLRAVADAGLSMPDTEAEVADPATGEVIAIAAAVWLRGLQEEAGSPVVLIFEPEPEVQAALEVGGYRVFHTADALRAYIENSRAGRSG
ncbi:DUF262 domain-containing protein [Streptomyces sp. NPDC085524]|uniref:GmrSD restriction endonuclease domain-containing protein n=1 Tax=Streptomyces sp. NPDC085524 TaxID=3365728 RepID=UPI0037CEA7D3